MKPTLSLALLWLGCSFAPSLPAAAQVPGVLNLSGRLSTGDVDVTGELDVTVTLYDDATSFASEHVVWTELQVVFVDQGRFDMLLGAAPESPLVLGPDDGELFVGIQVGDDEEMTPRLRVASVPFALRSMDAASLDGLVAADLALADHAHLLGDLPGVLEEAQLPATAVLDGQLATLLADKADLAHQHDDAYVGQGQPDSVTSAMIADGEVQLVDLGAPEGCAAGQVIKRDDGGAWICADDAAGTAAGVEDLVLGLCYDTPAELAAALVGWDQNQADDMTSGTVFGGDVTGTFSSLSLVPGAVASAEIDDATVFASLQDASGLPQFTVTDGATALRLEGTGGTSVSFDAASHRVTISSVSDAGGTVTAVSAGTGLTGATITDSGALALDTAFTDDRYVEEGQVDAVTSAMIADGTLSFGDLAQNGCQDGEAPTWEGVAGAWVCQPTGGVMAVTAEPPLSATAGTEPHVSLGIVPVELGGTGATEADGARANLGAAASGANADITSLSGLEGLALPTSPGAITGGGDGTGLDADLLDGREAADLWQVGGNAGLAAGEAVIGTTDERALEIHVGGERAMRIEPVPTAPYTFSTWGTYVGAANVIAGHPDNVTGEDTAAAVIAGGGGSFLSEEGEPYSLWPNSVAGFGATVGGGAGNTAGADGDGSFGVASDCSDTDLLEVLEASGSVGATVSGGTRNRADRSYATVAGGWKNVSYQKHASVGGGACNSVRGYAATIAGGRDNIVGEGADQVSIGGGYSNEVYGTRSTIAGGAENEATSTYAAIGGGLSNEVGGTQGTIGGGWNNLANGTSATVSGGEGNATIADYATIAGGSINKAGEYAFVGGGRDNIATGLRATISGGKSNDATGENATVPGGYANNAAGKSSFAAGHKANADKDGCFVWADASDKTLTCGTANRFVTRAVGGYWLYTNLAHTAGAKLTAGSGSWASASDQDHKRAIEPVDPGEVLERLRGVPISTWRYEAEPEAVRHMGPMAQAFHAAFGLGTDDRSIVTVDADGVALAAIQGLHALVEDGARAVETLFSWHDDLWELWAVVGRRVAHHGAQISALQATVAEQGEAIRALRAELAELRAAIAAR